MPFLHALYLTILAGFSTTGQFAEQVRVIPIDPGVTATIVAPPSRQFDPARPTLLGLDYS
jgi:hypothetical protein